VLKKKEELKMRSKKLVFSLILCLASVVSAVDPEGWWKMDDSTNLGLNSGTMGSAWNMTVFSTPQYVTPGAPGASPTGCVNFTASDADHLYKFNGLATSHIPGVTMCAWINAASWDQWVFQGSIFSTLMWDGTTNRGATLAAAQGGMMMFELGDGLGWTSAKSDPTVNPLSLNTWYFLAGTYDGSTIDAYINGQLVGQAFTTTATIDSTGVVNIARHPTVVTYYNGEIDDVRYYEEALTQAQIQTIMVPEPATMFLLGAGALIACRRRK